MDANLANAILENVDSTIYQIFQRCIPLNTVAAWTEAQEQVDGQLAIASQVVDSATSVPSLVIATNMFWRGKNQGWPDWNKIIDCPSEQLRCHPWYRPTTTIPSANATLDPPASNNETVGSAGFTDVRESDSGGMLADGGGERADALPMELQDDGIEREDLVPTRTQDAPQPSAETHHFEQTSQTASQSWPPVALRGSEDEERSIDQAETPSNEEDQLDEGPERGRSTTRATSPANRRGNARSKSRGRRMFPNCSPGSQIPGACSACQMGNYECSLSHHGGSCIQCKTRRKKCDFAGPRGPRRTHSRTHTRQRSQSPSTHSPPPKRPRDQSHANRSAPLPQAGSSQQRNPSRAPTPIIRWPRAQSRASRSASPPQAGSSQQHKPSRAPTPIVRKGRSSRVVAKKSAKITTNSSDPLTIVLPPLRKSATAASRKSGESPTTTAAPSVDTEERPKRPLPTRNHARGSPKRATEPAEHGLTPGAAYNLRGTPLVTREEHQELQRQITTMKAENDWLRSELKSVYTLIRDMDLSIHSLQGTVEATRQFSIRSGNQGREQPLGFPRAGTSQGTAPHLLSVSVATPTTGERDSVPPIETLAIGNEETADANPVVQSASITAGRVGDSQDYMALFTNDTEGIDNAADVAGI